jgi:hypothetical protein
MTPGQGHARRTGPPSSPAARCRRRGRARSPLPPPVRLTSLRPPVNVGPLPDPCSSKTGDRLGEVGESGHTNRVSAGRAKKLGNLRKTQKVSALGCHSVYDGVTKAGRLVVSDASNRPRGPCAREAGALRRARPSRSTTPFPQGWRRRPWCWSFRAAWRCAMGVKFRFSSKAVASRYSNSPAASRASPSSP